MSKIKLALDRKTVDEKVAGDFANDDRMWACCQAVGSGDDNVGPKSDPATVIVP